jgi:hypothetical protein
MSSVTRAPQILVIQRWTLDLAPLEEALRSAGIAADFRRVDFEAALDAALANGHFDVALFDPSTPELTRQVVEQRLAANGNAARVIELDAPDHAAAAIAEILKPSRN